LPCNSVVHCLSPDEKPANHCCSAEQTKQNQTLLIKNHQQLTHLPLAKEVPSAAQMRSLVTFFGFGKKVTRLSAGTDGFDLKTSNQ
jgi:hypothetical protein